MAQFYCSTLLIPYKTSRGAHDHGIVRDVPHHGGPSRDQDIFAYCNALNNLAPDSDPRTITDSDVATQMNSRADVYEISNPTIMVHSCPCVDDAMRADLSVNLDHPSRAYDRTGPNSAQGINPGLGMRGNSPERGGKF
jgi:hypothetical protein